MNTVRKKRTIGVLSKEADVKVTTIRYYESIGLMSEPDRSYSGQRIYQKDDVERLNFIRHARELGFSVDAIHELIALQNQPDQDCHQLQLESHPNDRTGVHSGVMMSALG